MRKVTAVVVVPALILSFSTARAADVTTDEMHQSGTVPGSMAQILQGQMFDGINLTEQQRQQMRDLMQQTRHEGSPISISDLEQLHTMIIADKFDAAGYKTRVDKIAQAEVVRQVEMAQVRNQMYHLLTPAQQTVLNQKYQQRMNEMRRLTETQQASPLQAVSNTGSHQ